VETAIVLAAFLTFIFGIIKFSLVLWTQSGLYYAAEQAARCASVNSTSCGTVSNITSYAFSHYYGQPMSANPFSYSATGCGHTVTASYTYPMTLPFAGTYSIPLTAAACFP
jgi:Flp pilus assembly protein TadG